MIEDLILVGLSGLTGFIIGSLLESRSKSIREQMLEDCIRDMLRDDDAQAWKEARKLLSRKFR